jgi:sensor histidine kinase YesM
MLLQPLLENALQHSVEKRSGPGLVRLEARTVAQGIELCVEDDGVGLATELARGSGQGIGLSTTRQRLAMLYGDRATLTLVPREGGGVRACLRLPLRARALEERVG